MAKVIKKGETIPKDYIYSFKRTVKYQEHGITKEEQYFTTNEDTNAYFAVRKRFEKEHPNVKILNICCD